MHYFAFFKLGSHLQFYHTVTHFYSFHLSSAKGLVWGTSLPSHFPSPALPLFSYFHETIFELDQLPDLTHLAETPKQSLSVWRQDNMTARTGSQSGNHRLYKNITLLWPAKVKQFYHLSWDPQSFNFISTFCYPSFHPTLSSTQSLMVTSLHFKHWRFTPTFHFLSFKSSSVLKSTSSLIKRIFKFLLGFLARDFIKRILEIRI